MRKIEKKILPIAFKKWIGSLALITSCTKLCLFLVCYLFCTSYSHWTYQENNIFNIFNIFRRGIISILAIKMHQMIQIWNVIYRSAWNLISNRLAFAPENVKFWQFFVHFGDWKNAKNGKKIYFFQSFQKMNEIVSVDHWLHETVFIFPMWPILSKLQLKQPTKRQ